MTPEEIGDYLEHQGLSDEEIDVFLEHVGVKGMKWGVRRRNRAATFRKVGAGKGTKSEKLRAYTNVGLIDLARGGGFRGAAKRKGERVTARNDRVRKGEASTLDKLKYVGGSKAQDLIPSRKSESSTKAAIGASIVGALIINIGVNVVKSKLSES